MKRAAGRKTNIMKILLVATLIIIPGIAAAENNGKLFEAEAECFYATKNLPTEKQADAFKACMKDGAPLYQARVECTAAAQSATADDRQKTFVGCLRNAGFKNEADRLETFLEGVEDYATEQEMNDFPDFE